MDSDQEEDLFNDGMSDSDLADADKLIAREHAEDEWTKQSRRNKQNASEVYFLGT